MALLDRFKKKKEVEMSGAEAKVASDVKKPESKKADVKKKEEKAEPKKTKVVRGETTRVIMAPVVSEKAAHLAAKNTYVFRVHPSANRVQVAQAFKELYNIQPTSVNVVNLRREPVRFGRHFGKQKAWKKAMITLPKGKSIQIYEGV
ncbi:MAG: 50S ribosomal protein L23 [Patescibacteria group bacterium]